MSEEKKKDVNWTLTLTLAAIGFLLCFGLYSRVKQIKTATSTAPAYGTHPSAENRITVKVNDQSKWEDVEGRTMFVFPNGNGVIYELTDGRGNTTQVAVAKAEKGRMFTITKPDGSTIEKSVREEDMAMFAWGNIIDHDVRKQRITPTLRDVSYYVR